VIDYALASAPRGPVALTIRDAQGRVVRRFASDAQAEELTADRYFEEGWLAPPARLSAAAGVHRFVWDLRYPRPPALHYEYSIAAVWHEGTPLDPDGPLVLPGRYSVTLTVEGKDYTEPLTVRLDPRVHVTQAALTQQLALGREVDGALELAVRTHHEIPDSLRATVERGDSSLAALAGVLGSLATAVQSADAAPTEGERAAFAVYRATLERAVARWRRAGRR
jgi:hypothetical protein